MENKETIINEISDEVIKEAFDPILAATLAKIDKSLSTAYDNFKERTTVPDYSSMFGSHRLDGRRWTGEPPGPDGVNRLVAFKTVEGQELIHARTDRDTNWSDDEWALIEGSEELRESVIIKHDYNISRDITLTYSWIYVPDAGKTRMGMITSYGDYSDYDLQSAVLLSLAKMDLESNKESNQYDQRL